MPHRPFPAPSPTRSRYGVHAGLRSGRHRLVTARVSFVAAQAPFTPTYVETASERDTLVYRVILTVPVAVAVLKQHARW
jgi:hypothetical protein